MSVKPEGAAKAGAPDVVHVLFAAQAAATPDAVAVLCQGGRLSYAQLNARANRLARRLRALGVGRDDRVALCLERTPDLIVALLAILKAGGAYLPLEATYPKARMKFMLEDARPKAIVTQASLLASLPDTTPPMVVLERDAADIDRLSAEEPDALDVEGDSLAYVLYTSGSTGTPKGVEVPHRAIERLVKHVDYATLGPTTTILQAAPVAFDASTFEIWGALLNGGRVALHPEPIPTARGLGESIRAFGVTTMWLTAALFNTVIDEDPEQLAGLQELLTGGEALSVPHIRRALERLPRTQLINGYGPTETTTFAVCHRIPRTLDAGLAAIPIGRAIRDTSLYILDAALQPVAEGATGELFIGGRGVARGYLARPELTAERFLPDPFATGRMYRTGDLVRMTADGVIDYIGRADQQVKIRGYRIELGEIEKALAELPGIRRCAVMARATAAGEKRLVAYVVAAEGAAAPTTSALRQSLSAVLPDYMVPSAFVWLDALPVTANGKLDRAALPEAAMDRPNLAVEYVAPRSPIEETLAGAWSEMLGVRPIGVNDNLFDLGATSLLVVRTIARLRERHRLDLPVVKVFEFPTVAGLAAHLEGRQGQGTLERAAAAVRRDRGGTAGIAIVGMAGRFPGAATVAELWQHLVDGVDSIALFDEATLDPTIPRALVRDPRYVKARGILEDADQFDAGFFGIAPKEAALMDPQQRILLEVAWETLENAGHVPDTFPGVIGAFAGKYNDTYYAQNVITRPDLIDELGAFQVMIGSEKDYIATRLAHRLDLKGPAISVHTGCSTSLVATVMAMQSLQAGHCDLALAGGASVTVPVRSGHLYQEGAMLSSDGHTRTFDAGATGTVFSDGVAMVALRRLEDAIADGDAIYGVIRGGALNNDGAAKASFTAPSVEGQARVIAMAHAAAGVDPRDISYVETHGTATPLGDPMEVEALTQAFRLQTQDRGFCGIGSVKSNIGHLVIAAGATGLIKTALSLSNRLIPATVHYRAPNPKIDFASSPFHVIDKTTPWPEGRTPRLAGVSSFGVGGTNAHVVVEEAPARETTVSQGGPQLLVLSARSPAALDAQSARLAAHLDQTSFAIEDVAFTLHAGRRAFPYRRVVVGRNAAELAGALRSGDPKRVVTRKAQAFASDVVFMFPGQGSQYPGMGAALYAAEPIFRAQADECLEALPPPLRDRLRPLVFQPSGPESADTLRQTALAQPALFIVEYATARLWQSWGVAPKKLIGHSVGEFVAAALAGVMSAPAAVRMVAERGQLMQDRPSGAMLSVRLAAADLTRRLTGSLGLAVENAPQSCVVAGPHEEVAAFQRVLEAEDIACRPLVTSHAFHSPMMDDAIPLFLQRLATVSFQRPQIPIVSTVTGVALGEKDATSAAYWARQLREPVRFASAAATVLADPNVVLLEVGPRVTLATLARQQITHKDSQSCVSSLGDGTVDEALAMRLAAGQLWATGVTVDAEVLHGPGRRRVPLPTYPFEHKRFWVDRVAPVQSLPITPPAAVEVPPPAAFTPVPAPVAPAPASVPIPESPKEDSSMPNGSPAPSDRRARLIEGLCQVIEETTGLEISAADAESSFVELGLDSLFLTQLTSAVQRKFDVKVTFRQLQEDYCSMDRLASYMDATLPAPAQAAAAPGPAPAAPAPVAATAVAPAAPVFAAAPVGSTAAPGSVAWLVEQQLRLMAQQLAMLGGVAPAPAPVVTPVAVAAAVAPAPTVAAPVAAAAAAPKAEPSAADEEGGGMMKYDVKKAFGAIARIHVHKTEEVTPMQKARLDAFVRRYNARTKGSKSHTQENRAIMADPRAVTGFRPGIKELIYPIVVDRSKGSRLWDIDGNEYVDALCGFGPNMFGWQPEFVTAALKEQIDRGYEIGPQHPLQAEVARLVCDLTKFDRAAFCNTGSEAVMGCMRVARTITGRNLIAIFTGAYHGIFDEVIVRGTKKLRSIPAAPGIMPTASQNVLVLDYGTPESLEILKARAHELAAIQVEPVQSRRPDFQPREFLQELRTLTEKSGSVYIFDEVVTGFRLGPGGAQEYFGIQADIAAYGKVVGGGLPIGIIAGKQRFMDALDGGHWQFGDASTPPVGVTYFAGTFVRHPLALVAARAVLLHLKEQGPKLQQELNERTTRFAFDLNSFVEEVKAPIKVKHFSSLWRATYEGDQAFGDLLFFMMRDRGVHIYDGFPCFFTTAHTEADYAHIAKAFKESVLEMQDAGFLPGQGRSAEKPLVLDPSTPPIAGARLGRDPAGNPAWFVPNPANPSKYIKLEAEEEALARSRTQS